MTLTVSAPYCSDAAAVAPDPRKGERLVLVTTRRGAGPAALLAHAAARGIGEILVPRNFVETEAMPLLGSGKVDYPAVERLLAGGRER